MPMSSDSPSFESNSFQINNLNISCDIREGRGQPLIFLHATGFNKAVWYEVVKELDNPVYLFDVPGHGKSDHPEDDFYWDQTASWLAESIKHLKLKNAVGIGHSMGGQVMLSVAHQLPDVFDQLLLLDPVVLKEEEIAFLQDFKIDSIAKRRNEWGSSDELYDVYANKAPFSDWQKQVLKDYVAQALKPAHKESSFNLACAPELEACVYQNKGSEHILEKLSDIDIPVHIIRARAKRQDEHPLSFAFSPTRVDLVDLLPQASDEQLTDWSHFFPMEYPKWLSEKILNLVAELEVPAVKPL